jgi:hypothetical protein
MCNVLTVPTVWYFNCHRQCGIFLLFLTCGILIALKYHTARAIKIPHCRNSKNIPHCWGKLKYHTVRAIKIPHVRNSKNIPHTMWNILIVPRMWYFNCPRQREMFLLFRQFDILTVTDNVESSYCSYSVVF